jgi:hypothetical protein
MIPILEGLSKDNEMIDVEKLDLEALGVKASEVDEAKKRLLSYVGETEKEMPTKVSPPGTLGLPPLLDKRRIDWEIPDGVFKTAPGALFDRILLFQIPLLAKSKSEALTFGGGLIAKSDQSKEKEQREAPRAVVVGAGLQALDSLRSHGVDLGHIVYFSKNTVYAIQVDYIAGKFERVSLAREGDLILSEDLAAAYAAGEVRIEAVETKDEHGTIHRTHYYVDAEGTRYNPVMPAADDDL